MFSSGEPWLTEMMLIQGMDVIVKWLETVAMDFDYVNPQIYISYADKQRYTEEWGDGTAGDSAEGVQEHANDFCEAHKGRWC